MERARRRGATAGRARRIVVARAGRRRGAPRAPRERHGPHGRARDVPVRPGAPVADRRRRSARAARRIRAHVRSGPAVAGVGARADARGAGDRRHGRDGTRAHRWPHASRRHRRSRPCARCSRAPPTVADRSVLDAFRILWQDLPYSARLVADAERSSGARREIDVVVGLSGVVAEAGESPDPSTEAFVRALDAGEHGPGYRGMDPASSGRGTRPDRARCGGHRARHGRRRRRRRRELPEPLAARADVRPGGARTADLADPNATGPAWRTNDGCSA